VVGDSAIKIDPNDHAGIADSLLKLERSTELRKTYTQKGVEQAQKYSWERYARETLQMYESLK